MSALATTAQGGPHADVGDGELVRRVRRGDEQAFEQLYHRYHRRITGFIFGMVHDHGRAEDLAQDVFVSALRRMRDTDRPIAFKPWIYEIAKNACIDQFRRSRRAEEVSYDAEGGMGASDYGRLVSSDATPENELESKQNLDHLCGAFGGLSETHHEILVMRELEGLSYREIGERLGMSRPSVESTLFRARRRLTEEYEELVSGARCQRIQAIIAVTAADGESAVPPGARDQRRLARHVSHCQPCRRQARLAGLEIPAAADRPVRQRIAALLPLPLFLRRRWASRSGDAAGVGAGHVSGLAQWSAQMGSALDPSWLKAAATAATVAVAGAGAGLAGSAPATTAPIGSFGQVIPAFGAPDDGGRLVAGAHARISAALLTGTMGVASPSAGVPAAASAGPESAQASTTTTTTAPTPASSPLKAVGDRITQVADAVSSAGGGSAGSTSTSTSSGQASGGSSDASASPAPSLPGSILPAPGGQVPTVDATVPAASSALDDTATKAGDTLTTSLTGG